MTILTVIILLFLVIRLGNKYDWTCVLHPGLWFGALWILALACYWAIDVVGGVFVHDEDALAQLTEFISVTAITFIILTYTTKTPKKKTTIILKTPFLSNRLFGVFTLIGIAGSLINWVGQGANFGYDDSIRQQWLQEIPRVTAITWYLYIFSFPAAIASGWIFSFSVLKGHAPRWVFRFLMLLPLISGAIWSIGTGGRQALGIMIFHFAAGFVFGLALGIQGGFAIPRRRLIKAFTLLFLGILLFALFIGLTGLSRAKQQGSESSAFDSIWYLAPIGQFIGYTGLSIASHQAYGYPKRRDISETGPVTLAGFQEFGLRFFTGWRRPTVDDTNPERALASSGQVLAYWNKKSFLRLTS